MSINQLLANFPTNTQFTVPTSNQGAVTFSVGGPPGGGVVPLPTVTQQVFVAPWGSDTTGDGGEETPFATIAHAQASILDSGPAKIYQLILYPGVYTEAVALEAFINIVGWNASNVTVAFYPSRITGAFTLGASFGGAQVGQQTLVTNVDVDGTLTLDYVSLTATSGSASFTNCQLEATVTLTNGSSNDTEFHDCIMFGDFTQIGGGRSDWYNTIGVNQSATLTLTGFIFAFGGAWPGSVNLDQTGFVGQVILNSQGFSMSRGNVNIISAGGLSPVLLANLGDSPENCNMSGAAALMAFQQRISHQFTGITGAVAGTAVTTIDLVVPAALIGATSIESLQCSCSPVGANWGSIFGPHAALYNFRYEQAAGVATIHFDILNTGAGFNITDALTLNFYAYLPSVI